MKLRDIIKCLVASYLLLLVLIVAFAKVRDLVLDNVPCALLRTGLYLILLVALIGAWSALTYRMFRGIERSGLKEFQTQEELRSHDEESRTLQIMVKERKPHT